MKQTTEFSHEPSLLQNGAFDQGPAFWFGQYLRHRVVAALPNAELVLPTYAMQVTAGQPDDYLSVIDPGLHQFLDVPELYSYPSNRFCTFLELRYVGEELFLIRALEGSSQINGETVVGGTGLFQHPFLFQSTEGFTAISPGDEVIVNTNDARYSGQYTAGAVIRDVQSDNTVFADHLTQLSRPEAAPVDMSVADFPDVQILVGLPNQVGFGTMRFIGEGIENLLTFQRPNGLVGLKVNDSLVVQRDTDGKTFFVRIDQVGDSITPGDPDSLNVVYQQLAAVDNFVAGFDALVWEVSAPQTVSANFTMPLYSYDYTLSYTYDSVEGAPPSPAKISFRGLDTVAQTLHGLGDIVEQIHTSTALTREIPGTSNGSWIKRYEYLRGEFDSPVEGRALLSIPIPAVELTTFPEDVVSLAYIPGIDRLRIEYDYEAESGFVVDTAVYPSGSQYLTFQVSSHPFSDGDVIYLAGYGDDINFPAAGNILFTLANTGLAFAVEFAVADSFSIRIPTELIPNDPETINNLDQSTFRIRTEPTQAFRFQQGDNVRVIDPDNVTGETWYEEIIGQVRQIQKFSIDRDFSNALSTRMIAEVPWGLGFVPIVAGTYDHLDFVNAAISDEKLIVGDVNLWKGYSIYASSFDGVNEVDQFTTHIDTANRLFPKAAVVLMSGTTCPNGFLPVRRVATSLDNSITLTEEQSLLFSLPSPDERAYDSENDLTTFSFDTGNFDLLDELGQAVTVPGEFEELEVALPGTSSSTGGEIVQTITVPRTRKVVEPGMQIRADILNYSAGQSSVVGLGPVSAKFTELDYVDPVAKLDPAFIVTDITSRAIDSDAASVSVASARAIKSARLSNPLESFSTYAGGSGVVTYPSYTAGEFTFRNNTYGALPPAGPPIDEQTERFPIAGRPFAFLRTRSRDSQFGETRNALICRRLASETGTTNGPDFIDYGQGVDAFGQLTGEDAIKTGDVFYARMYFSPDRDFLVEPPVFVDSFVCQLEELPDGRWRVYRYDFKPIKYLRYGSGSFPQDTTSIGDGDFINEGLVVLHPVKLYGAPGQTQAIRTAPDTIGIFDVSPQGSGSPFIQRRVTIGGAPTWVTFLLSTGTDITLAGNLTNLPVDSSYYVEPSGVLRYEGDPISNLMDYGASGHNHTVSKNTDIQQSEAVPRTHPSVQDQYGSSNIPRQHGHRLETATVFPIPLCNMFTLCQKL